MGLISWFKDKYNNHKFQKAKELLLDGKKEQAGGRPKRGFLRSASFV